MPSKKSSIIIIIKSEILIHILAHLTFAINFTSEKGRMIAPTLSWQGCHNVTSYDQDSHLIRYLDVKASVRIIL